MADQMDLMSLVETVDPSEYLDTWTKAPRSKRLGLLDQLSLEITPRSRTLISGGDPSKMADVVDVSHWQTVDFARLRNEGKVSMAFVKSSDGAQVRTGDPTQTKYYIDDKFYASVDACHKAGMACGPYHYVQPNVPGATMKGTIDWNWTVIQAAMKPLTPGVSYQAYCLDFEEKTTTDANGGDVMRGLIERIGNDPKLSQVPLVVYTSMGVLNYYSGLMQFLGREDSTVNLWMAQWVFTQGGSISWEALREQWIPKIDMRVKTPGFASWKWLQYAACFALPGCDGRLDLDKFYSTEANLYAWLKFTGKPPVTPPPNEEKPPVVDTELAKQVAQNTADIAAIKAWKNTAL